MAGRVITRFAPSPTGLLHLGHAYAALFAAQSAGPGGQFLLRIEDIDRDRCRAEYEAAIYDDLRWLGLDWPQPVMRQSDRMPAYRAALHRLAPLSYPCRCRRGDIRAALSAPQEGALPAGPDGLIYPGTCRGRSLAGAGPDEVIRLDVGRAFDALGIDRIGFHDDGPHQMTRAEFQERVGDVILARRGMGTSYHLAVVVDDAAQGVTLVTRGRDLFDSTWIHVLLQHLLGLPLPDYRHHRLIRDDAGKRLAKRDDARSLRSLRDGGASPDDVLRLIGLAGSCPKVRI
ncbi:MAG: tRNA glutamyl-Q(34) synthetase GluQRS [Paracoccus sp. (in: a-proteobacteria)]|uniref:tRNA glutamyl-Q(34) synthetase GluQRS n=1 Tax=Paracoccus sp. TaxID=267 RepID=UPI0026E0DE3A|nr:tRNA glutamyl-Q(34) synthetase GluQRS [Paracoccus sp. (in: a-proteobacteria)]MDO5614319.1 tRNA glutamyl-Q(34) synthetase GluQRS [Paracoccus sp. (in: a-proteobacteria)]